VGLGKHILLFFLPLTIPSTLSLFNLTMDEVLSAWKKLSLTAEESTKLSLSKSKNLRRKEYILAAKFLTKRALNVDAIGRTFKPLWRVKNEFKFREVGDHILLFIFELETDAKRVLAKNCGRLISISFCSNDMVIRSWPNTYALQRSCFGCKYIVCL